MIYFPFLVAKVCSQLYLSELCYYGRDQNTLKNIYSSDRAA